MLYRQAISATHDNGDCGVDGGAWTNIHSSRRNGTIDLDEYTGLRRPRAGFWVPLNAGNDFCREFPKG